MSLGNFTTNFLAQVDNPACSYLVGGMIGQIWLIRFYIIAMVIMLAFKVIEKLALDPLIEAIKNWIKKRRKRKC
jgi:hypothetical protein